MRSWGARNLHAPGGAKTPPPALATELGVCGAKRVHLAAGSPPWGHLAGDGEVVIDMKLSRGSLRFCAMRSLASIQRAVKSHQGVNARVVQVTGAKLGNPAGGQFAGRRFGQGGIGGPACTKPVPQDVDLRLDVHADKASKILLDGQVTSCLGPVLAFQGMKKSPKTILAENVKRLRESRGWSQPELGRISGVRQTTISFIEREAVDTSIDKVELLAKAFKLPTYALMMPDVDEAMFKHNGLGDIIDVYPKLPEEGRAELSRTVARERRYSLPVNSRQPQAPALPPPPPNTAREI